MKAISKAIAYKALDLVTGGRGVRRVISGESVRLPARWSRYYEAGYEPATFAFLREHCRPGATVMDVGAHIGLFTVVMARRVEPAGRVYSFEPTPYTCDVLRETVRLNGCGPVVEVHQKAVARQSGRASFFDTGDVVSNANSLVATGRSKGEIPVETVSLDEFLPPGTVVRLLKIDVEGAELAVLRGAEQTFAAGRPALHLGLHPPQIREAGGSLAEVWDVLESYRMAVSYQGKAVDGAWFRDHDDLFDVQALPAS